jgi:endonuclease YncB( thermonuclease family)
MGRSLAHPDGAWQFDATHVEVIDGDTLRVLDADVGFGIRFAFDLRLRGVDAPERSTPQGQAAANALARLIAGRPLVVTTYRRVASGREVRSITRWVGDAVLDAGLPTACDVATELVRLGLARPTEPER